MGVLALSLTFNAYLTTIVDYGFSYSGTKQIAQTNSCIKRSIIYTEIIISKFLLFILSAPILLTGIYLFKITNNNFLFYFISILYIPFHILFSEFVFQGIQRMWPIALSNCILKCFYLILVLTLVNGKEDLLLIPLFNLISYALASACALFLLRNNKISFIPTKKLFKNSISRIKNEYHIFLTIFFPNLYNNTSILLLSAFSSISVVGVFDIARKISTVPEQIVTIYCRTFYPSLAINPENRRKFIKIGIALCLISSFLLFSLSSYIIKIFFPPEFQEASLYLKLLALSPIFLFLSTAYGTCGLYLINEEKKLRNITINTSIISFLFSFPLINLFSSIGVIFLIYISRFIIFILCYFNFIKSNKNIQAIKNEKK